MSRYARGTSVTEDRSRAQIERDLMRFGAEEFGYLSRPGEATIFFKYRQISVQLSVPLPDREDHEFTRTPTGKARAQEAALREWSQETRRRWRSLCAVIKALLVGVDDGVLSFEQAFLPFIMWGDGRTTSQHLLPTIEKALEGGGMPRGPKLLEAV